MHLSEPPSDLPEPPSPSAGVGSYPYGPQPALVLHGPPRTDRDYDEELFWWLSIWPEIAVVGGFAAFNCLVPLIIKMFRSEPVPLIALAMAIVLTEVCALSVRLVFSEARFWLRWPVAVAVGYGLGIIFILAITPTDPGPAEEAAEVIRAFLCGAPLVFLAVQVPLWAARLYFGWRIVKPRGDLPAARPLSIADILIGTVLVAVAAGGFRLAPDSELASNSGFWIGWGLGLVAIGAVSSISILPMLYFSLRPRNASWGACFSAAYATLVAAIVVAFAVFMNGGEWPIPEVCLLSVGTPLVWTAAFWGFLQVLRWRGDRLLIGRGR